MELRIKHSAKVKIRGNLARIGKHEEMLVMLCKINISESITGCTKKFDKRKIANFIEILLLIYY